MGYGNEVFVGFSVDEYDYIMVYKVGIDVLM